MIRNVAISCGIVELITVIIALVANAAMLLFATSSLGERPSNLMGVVLTVFISPWLVGTGWIVGFALALHACILAHARAASIQPGGWDAAKTPTAVQLSISIILGLPSVVTYVALYEYASVPIDMFRDTPFIPVLVICMASQIMMAFACIVLLRKSAALTAAIRAPETGA